MKKEIISLLGIISLSGCRSANYPEVNNYVGIATSDSDCYTDVNVHHIRFYSRLEFDVELTDNHGKVRDSHVVYFRDGWANCTGFPKIFANDKVRITGGIEQGNVINVTLPEGIVRNLSHNSRY